MRAVDKAGNIFLTNQQWDAGLAQPGQGVWATVHIRQSGAKLRIYDAAPNTLQRHCLAEHSFPLKEPVVLLGPEFQPALAKTNWLQSLLRLFRSPFYVESTMS